MPRIRVNALSPHDGQQENDVDHYQVRDVTQGVDLDTFGPGIPDGEELPFTVEYPDDAWDNEDEIQVRAVDTDGNAGPPISFPSACIPSVDSISAPDFVQTGSTFTLEVGASVAEGSLASVEAVYEGESQPLSLSGGVYTGEINAAEAGTQEIAVTATESSQQGFASTGVASVFVGQAANRRYQHGETGVPVADSGTDGVDLTTLVSGEVQKVTSEGGSDGITGAVLEAGQVENPSTDVFILSLHLKFTDGISNVLDRRFAKPIIEVYSGDRLKFEIANGVDCRAVGLPTDEEMYLGFEFIKDEVFRIVRGDGIGDDGRVTNPVLVNDTDPSTSVGPNADEWKPRYNYTGKEIYDIALKTQL